MGKAGGGGGGSVIGFSELGKLKLVFASASSVGVFLHFKISFIFEKVGLQ